MTKTSNPDFFFSPRNVAIVGATPVKGRISNIILESLRRIGFPGRIFPVNPKYSSIEGMDCHPSLTDIKEEIDVAVFAVPAAMTPGLIRDARDNIKGAVIISGGFGEMGAEGKALESELRGLASSVRIIGPNCMGIYDTVSRLDTFFISFDRIKRPQKGRLSIISQSGSFAVTAMDELAAEGIGIARVVSYGNKADMNEADCLEFLADDEHTGAVAVYIESVSDGRRFVAAAAACSAKKPVLAIKVGKTAEAAGAARSHTGAVAGRYEIYRAAFKKAGIIELGGYEDFISACKAYGMELPPARGRRVMIITDGGGIGVALADACAWARLQAAPLPDELRDELKKAVPAYFAVSNPMDLTGSATDGLFADSLEKALAGDNYDIAIVAPMWGPPALSDNLPKLIADKARKFGKPVIICTPGGEFTRSRTELFRKQGLPVFLTPESAVKAAMVLADGAGR